MKKKSVQVKVFYRIAPTAAAASTNPYLQQMYAAAAAAASNPAYAMQGAAGTNPTPTGLIPFSATTPQSPLIAQTGSAGASTGNPLLDAYSQYAALAAAGVATTGATTGTMDVQTSKNYFTFNRKCSTCQRKNV